MSDSPTPNAAGVAYTASDMVSLEGLDVMRNRPNQFLVDRETRGQTHLIKEVTDNGLDETSLLGEAGLLTVLMCRNAAANSYQIVVRDNGRGIPVDSSVIVRAWTKPNTSTKYNTAVYKNSIGSLGVGGKVASGLSKRFRGMTARAAEGIIGSLLIQDGKHPSEATITKLTIPRQGVTVVLEPDEKFFADIAAYADTGYLTLVELFKKYCFFRNYNVQFRVNDEPLPESVWSDEANAAQALIDRAWEGGHVVFDNRDYEPLSWLRQHWGVQRPFSWDCELRKPDPQDGGLQDWQIRLYTTKFEQTGNRFGMINNVPIDHAQSNHFSVLTDELKQALAQRIEKKEVRHFFMEAYRLPIFMAVDVKFEGAEFTGATKHAFTSALFRELYGADLKACFQGWGEWAIKELYAQLEEDILTRYKNAMSKEAPKSTGRLFLDLKRPLNFRNCETKGDRRGTELFLTEGASAANMIGHNTQLQAIYEMRGKPLNAVKTKRVLDPKHLSDAERDEFRKKLLGSETYHDIMKVINYNPERPNLNALRFERCFIMTDGDFHGRHISSLLIGNFSVLCPELVQSGYFSIVTPPYYELTYGSRKNSAKIFLRTAEEVLNWKTHYIYSRAFKIERSVDGGALEELDYNQFATFIRDLFQLGAAIQRLADEFILPPLLIEAFSLVTEYLKPGKFNQAAIEAIIGAARMTYYEDTHVLKISMRDNDYIVPLHGLPERIYDEVMPILRRFTWRKTDIYITSRQSGMYRREPFSLMHFYLLLEECDRVFITRNFKGLGSMKPIDQAVTCMDPRNRRTLKVTDIGDIDVIFDLLGSDSDERKELLDAT